MKKEIAKYILRLVIFLLLIGSLYDKATTFLAGQMQNISTILYEKHPIFADDENMEILLSIIESLTYLLISFSSVNYIFAKICGLFKEIDHLKKWQRFSIIIRVSVFCILLTEILCKFKNINFNFSISFGFAGYFLLPTYLLYIYLNHLTKKYIFLQKLGHYFSAEFYKDLYLKLK